MAGGEVGAEGEERRRAAQKVHGVVGDFGEALVNISGHPYGATH
jgi:hypothetical protein